MAPEIIAILRGIKPQEALAIGEALIDNGVTKFEVTLNSPNPLQSIETLANSLGDVAEVGAGTVLTAGEVQAVSDAGGRFIVSPNMQPEVITATKRLGLRSLPGVQTATECFNALNHGADGLKFFPSMLLGPDGLRALSAVLPEGTRTYAVGGVGPENFAPWVAAGITGFGIGSFLFKPGFTPEVVGEKAAECFGALELAIQS